MSCSLRWKFGSSSTLILTSRQSVHASGTLLVFMNFSNLVSLFDLGFRPFVCLAPGDESLEDEELLACCFVNINLDSKAKCARFRHTVGFYKFYKFSEFVWSGFRPFGCLAPGDESSEDEELLGFPCNNCTWVFLVWFLIVKQSYAHQIWRDSPANPFPSIRGLFSRHESKVQVNRLLLFPSKQTNRKENHTVSYKLNHACFLLMLPKKTTKIVYYFMKSDTVHCPVYAAVWLCSQDQLLCKPYCCLHWLWIAGDQTILFSQKKALKLIFCFCFISDCFKKSDSVHCCMAVQSRSIAFASLIVACIGFELLVIKRSFFPCSRKK